MPGICGDPRRRRPTACSCWRWLHEQLGAITTGRSRTTGRQRVAGHADANFARVRGAGACARTRWWMGVDFTPSASTRCWVLRRCAARPRCRAVGNPGPSRSPRVQRKVRSRWPPPPRRRRQRVTTRRRSPCGRTARTGEWWTSHARPAPANGGKVSARSPVRAARAPCRLPAQLEITLVANRRCSYALRPRPTDVRDLATEGQVRHHRARTLALASRGTRQGRLAEVSTSR